MIRYKALLAHRINGYIIILLIIPSHAGALMIARYAFGGDLATQTGVGMLAIMTTGSIFLAYYNIKRLQIDQHRAWMLRTWFYVRTSHFYQTGLPKTTAPLSRIFSCQ